MEEKQIATREYAGFWIRLTAYLIDGIILWLIGLITDYVSWQIFRLSEASDITVRVALTSVAWLINIAYFVGFWTWRGQTPGKILLGVRVVGTDGSPLSIRRAFLRYLGYIVSGIMLLIGFLWIAFDSRKQGIHDKIADTYVVRLPPKGVVSP